MQSPARPWRVLYLALGSLALLWACYALRGVLTPVFFAFLLAYMLDPAADRIEELGLPRAAAIVILLAGALVGMTAISLLVLPDVVRDFTELARELPQALSRVLSLVEPWLAEHGVEIPGSGREVLASFEGELRQLAPSALGSVRSALSTVLGGTASALGALAGAVMVPILAFYLLYDFDRIVAAIRELLPHSVRESVVAAAREVDEVLGQFVRGQLIVMAILAILYATAYQLLGVRLAVPIGLVAGLLSFIPYVGGAVALGLALLMVALHFQGLLQLLGVVAAYTLVQILEGFVITPRVVGDKLGLAPVWVLFALMVGGELFGFMGVMLALPVAAVVKVFVMRGLVRYRQSTLFTGEETSASAAPSRVAFKRHRSRRATSRRPPRELSRDALGRSSLRRRGATGEAE